MTENPSLVVHFRDCDQDDKIKESIERHAERIGQEFHEVSRIEITIEPNGASFSAHGHATGKGTDAAVRAEASEAGPAADLVFVKLERQLRKNHDKRIFTQRRDAQKAPAKRQGS